MPLGETGLPAEAEQARMERSLAQMQERATNQAAAVPPEDRGRGDAGDRVEGAGQVAGTSLLGGGRGAPSFTPRRGREKPEPGPDGEPPPDPAGRGRTLDVRG